VEEYAADLMRLHMITNLFAPDELAGAALFTDLALFLRDCGHDVRVTTTFSYYPAWRLRPEDEGVSVSDECAIGIPVRRVAMYVPNRLSARSRMVSELSFLVSLIRHARHPGWLPDVVLTALPMLSQCLAQRFLYVGKGIPRLIVVQDFVVDAALELGMLRLPGFVGFLHATQRFALCAAQTLVTISPLMLAKLRRIMGANHRTRCLCNWVHASLLGEIDRQTAKHHPQRSGVLLYAGNIGVKQGLPEFLALFRSANAAESGWQLEIHGGGAELDRLSAEVSRTPGCQLGPVLPQEDYVTALLTASACLVTQRAGVSADFLPSKLLPALATGTPVLAVCERTSPLGQEVGEGEFGAVVCPGDTQGLAQTLRCWRKEPDLTRAMSAKARERARLYHRDRILPEYETELLALTNRPARTGAL